MLAAKAMSDIDMALSDRYGVATDCLLLGSKADIGLAALARKPLDSLNRDSALEP